jgi:transcriptional regulator with XRE-family HTH domain
MTTEASQSDIFKRVSANITAAILASGMSQNAVAEKLGVNSGNFSNQLRTGNFRIDRLYSLAEILDCDIGDFFSE